MNWTRPAIQGIDGTAAPTNRREREQETETADDDEFILHNLYVCNSFLVR